MSGRWRWRCRQKFDEVVSAREMVAFNFVLLYVLLLSILLSFFTGMVFNADQFFDQAV